MVTARAVTDLERIAQYYRLNAPTYEKSLVAAIYRAVEDLQMSGEKGTPIDIRNTRRMLVVRTPYLVIYRVTETSIASFVSANGARKPLVIERR